MADMVDPSGVPSFTGDFGLLEEEAAALKEDAGKIRDTGSGVHATFQGLSAFYTAPEADQLFGSTRPVSDRADDFADDLEKVAGALVGFAEEARPIVARLERLKGEAQSFVDSVKDDDEWTYDEEKIETNNALVGDISAAVAEFWAAERSAANKITALVNGTQWVAGDGSDGANMYGLSVEDMRQAGETPWGKMAEEDHHWYEVGHWVKSYVWDGFIVDGIWGTLTGLGGLVGLRGWETFKDSWKGLGQLATGILIIGSPLLAAATYAVAPEGARTWMRESLNTTKEVGKSLVAWDEWGENPGRAAGLVTFNVLTTVATLGTGTAVRGASASGTAARVMNAAGRAGRIVDPMTYIGNGLNATFRGLPRLTDVTSGLADLSAVRAVELPDGTMRLPDGTTFAPDAPTLPDLPPGSTAVELPDGSVVTPDGTALRPDGTVTVPHTQDTPPATVLPDAVPAGAVPDGAPTGAVLEGLPESARPDSVPAGAVPDGPDATGAEVPGGAVDDAAVDPDAVRTSDEAPTSTTDDAVAPASPDDTGVPGPRTDGEDTSPTGLDDEPARSGQDATSPGHEPDVTAREDESSDMGTRREQAERTATDSRVPAPPKEPADLILDSGDHVYFSPETTTIGYDTNTMLNRELIAPQPGVHDIIIHGSPSGYFLPGHRNAAGENFNLGEVHPTHIADAVRNNPNYDGGPIRLVSCHSGRVNVAGEIPAAQEVANQLGVTVTAPTQAVGVFPRLPPGQVPKVFDDGYWRTFLPLVRS
ncbi:hypothetical protein [Streptomyces sp. GSL17-111]|uniref:hypothetical protein n=1 Tax=Streptomyces sp. GSL17-111 TaxID=3121596 RepID=UPI0030F39ACE